MKTQTTSGGRHEPNIHGEVPATPPAAPGTGSATHMRSIALSLAIPLVAVALWAWSFSGAEPRDMGVLGLLSLFTPVTAFALALLLGGFLASLYKGLPSWVLGTFLVTYIVLIHGTPAVLYGTLRYSWAYKHVGIVEYIQRHGSVDTTLDAGQIYQNWPGFFAGGALLTDFSGQSDVLQIASWAPVVFNLSTVIVLRYVFRGLTRNRTLIWLGLMFFLLINWVGQDYFSPQAVGLILYLAMVGLMLRPMSHVAMIGPFAVIVAAVALTHQITPLMMLMAVVALTALRRTNAWQLPIVALTVIAGWAFTGALDYTLPNLRELVSEFGNVVDNADQTLEKANAITGTALLVVWGGRSTVAIAGLLSVFGIWSNRNKQGNWHRWDGMGARGIAAILMLLPGILVLTTGFGGEVLFRAFLFASPFIAILAAETCLPRDGQGFPLRSLVSAGVVIALVTPGFLLGYYGKEQQNYFPPEEVEASSWVYTHAAPGSLLVEGSPNYPARFIDYEKFTYVPLDREPEESIRGLLSDPAARLSAWLVDSKYTEGYVLITRGQKIAVNAEQSMPEGSLERIEEELRQSDRFEIAYETTDATVFRLSDVGRNQ